jgi:hypothetical protein
MIEATLELIYGAAIVVFLVCGIFATRPRARPPT